MSNKVQLYATFLFCQTCSARNIFDAVAYIVKRSMGPFSQDTPWLHGPLILTQINSDIRAWISNHITWVSHFHSVLFNSLWPKDTIWWLRTLSTLLPVMAGAWWHQAIDWTNVDQSIIFVFIVTKIFSLKLLDTYSVEIQIFLFMKIILKC